MILLLPMPSQKARSVGIDRYTRFDALGRGLSKSDYTLVAQKVVEISQSSSAHE